MPSQRRSHPQPILSGPAAMMLDAFNQMIMGFIMMILYQSTLIPDKVIKIDPVAPQQNSTPSEHPQLLGTIFMSADGGMTIGDKPVAMVDLASALAPWRSSTGDVYLVAPEAKGAAMIAAWVEITRILGRSPKIPYVVAQEGQS